MSAVAPPNRPLSAQPAQSSLQTAENGNNAIAHKIAIDVLRFLGATPEQASYRPSQTFSVTSEPISADYKIKSLDQIMELPTIGSTQSWIAIMSVVDPIANFVLMKKPKDGDSSYFILRIRKNENDEGHTIRLNHFPPAFLLYDGDPDQRLRPRFWMKFTINAEGTLGILERKVGTNEDTSKGDNPATHIAAITSLASYNAPHLDSRQSAGIRERR